MSFTVYFRSTGPVNPAICQSINAFLDEACSKRFWLGCEPPRFLRGHSDDYLFGGSKLNFLPAQQEFDEARRSGLPQGTIEDVIALLARASSLFAIDWQFSHDHDEGPVGFIRKGEVDSRLSNEIDGVVQTGRALVEMSGILPGLPGKFEQDPIEGGGPVILKFELPENQAGGQKLN